MRSLPVIAALLTSLVFSRAAIAADTAADNNGFCRYAGTLSPDNAYEFVWTPTNLSPDDRAKLKEWPADTKVDIDTGFDSFLYDSTHSRFLAMLPEVDYWEGQGSRKNRGEIYVGWAPDSRSGIVIIEERWDDEAILWVEPAENRLTNLKDALEKACSQTIRTREKDRDGLNMQFSDPAILPGGILVIDSNAGHMKEGPYYHYRLTFHISRAKDKIHAELLKARAVSEKEDREHDSGVDYDPDLNRYYARLRGRLDDKGRAVLKAEEETWLQWRDKQPEPAREKLTERRAVELRARCEK